MTHQPTPLDVACDLRRCIYASFSEVGFDDSNFRDFLAHGLADLECVEDDLNPKLLRLIRSRLAKVQNSGCDISKRREDILLAANLLASG